MNRTTTTRNQSVRSPRAGLLLGGMLCAVGLLHVARAERGHPRFQQIRPAPVERRPPQPVPQQRPQANSNGGFSPHAGENNQQHLSQWMQSHQNMPLEEQQRALEAEPGFHQLNPEVQARMHQQIARLNSMTPERRQLAMARTEWMEHLAPEQRLQVHSALSSLGELPPDRRRIVARTFNALRNVPDAQRQAYLNSSNMRGQFSDQERTTLNGLFSAAPYMPPPMPPGPQAPR